MTTTKDLTKEVYDICSCCGHKTKLVYDLFGDGLILYCEDCYLEWLKQQKKLI